MRGLLILIFILSALHAEGIKTNMKPSAYVDFGVHGKEYDIKEESFYTHLLNEAKNLKFDKDEIKETIKSEINRLAKYKSKISFCKDSEIIDWHQNIYEFKETYANPNGRVTYKKGDKIQAPLVSVQQDICFLDGRIMPTLQNQINFFKEKYPKCVFLFSNVNVRGLQKVFSNLNIFPANDSIIDRFDVKCSIGVISLKDDKIKKEYFSIEKFKRLSE